MHTGKPLFDGQDEGDQMVKQVEVLGVPPRHMLEENRKADKFFEISQSTGQYRLKRRYGAGASLNGSVRASLEECGKFESTQIYLDFVDLINQMLIYDPLKRIRPSQALHHPFFVTVANVIALEAGVTNNSAAAAAALGAKLASPSGNPLGSGSGVASSLAPSTGVGSSPAASSAATAMDTSSSAAFEAQKLSDLHKLATSHHHHHAHQHRSNSRKRPHSNPVMPVSSVLTPEREDQITQAWLAQRAQQQTATAATASTQPAAAAAADPNSTAASSRMQDAPSEPSAAPAASSSTATPSKHGMVTRSAVSGSSAKRDSLDIAKLAVASPGSSASNSARSSPVDATQSGSTLVVNDLESRSRGNSQLVVPDASTVTTAAASTTSSPNATAATGAQGAPTITPGTTTATSSAIAAAAASSSSMVDIEPVVPEVASKPAGSSGGKGRKGKRGGKRHSGNNATSNPNASESESENGPAASSAGTGVGSSQLSRMSLDLDRTAAVGHRTRSHANQ